LIQVDAGNDTDTRIRIEAWLGIGAVALLGLGCAVILLPFISAALWAAILCFTTWPLFVRLKMVLGGRRTIAALLATLVLSAIIVAPVAILVNKLSGNMADIIAATQKLIHEGPPAPPAWVVSLPIVGDRLASWWQLMSQNNSARLAEIAKWLPAAKSAVLGSGRALAGGVFQIILSLLMVFLFYRDGESASNRLSVAINRIGGAEGSHLLDVAGATMRAVVYGVLGTAMLQGVLAGLGFMVAGVPGAVLLGFLTFVLAVIPGGPILVAAPAIFWLYHRGSVAWAVSLLVWVVIVGNLDSVVRPLLISRGGGTTPLILVVLGVLGGAMAFGLIGLFLGPTLLAVGYSLFDEWSSSTHRLAPDIDNS
jgi:predicted PurR-regulated permease PerM